MAQNIISRPYIRRGFASFSSLLCCIIATNMVLIICPSPEPSYSMQKFGRWLILKYLFKVIGCLRPYITELQIFNLLYKELKFWDLRGIMGLLLLCVSPCLPVYNNHSYKDVLWTFYFRLWLLGVLGRTGISISVL